MIMVMVKKIIRKFQSNLRLPCFTHTIVYIKFKLPTFFFSLFFSEKNSFLSFCAYIFLFSLFIIHTHTQDLCKFKIHLLLFVCSKKLWAETLPVQHHHHPHHHHHHHRHESSWFDRRLNWMHGWMDIVGFWLCILFENKAIIVYKKKLLSLKERERKKKKPEEKRRKYSSFCLFKLLFSTWLRSNVQRMQGVSAIYFFPFNSLVCVCVCHVPFQKTFQNKCMYLCVCVCNKCRSKMFALVFVSGE